MQTDMRQKNVLSDWQKKATEFHQQMSAAHHSPLRVKLHDAGYDFAMSRQYALLATSATEETKRKLKVLEDFLLSLQAVLQECSGHLPVIRCTHHANGDVSDVDLAELYDVDNVCSPNVQTLHEQLTAN